MIPESKGPPRVSRALLATILHPADRECALADLEEEFETRVARDGERAARHWYRAQVRMSVVPALLRQISARLGVPTNHNGPGLGHDFRWAWRGVRSRGWRAVFVVSLLGVALAANAIVFAAADSFVFRTVPYHEPDRLVVIERVGRSVSDYLRPDWLREWRNHRDLFAGIHAHVGPDEVYLTFSGITESVAVEHMTPGMFELLGVLPAWGRPFTIADAPKDAPPVGIIGEALARRLFADPVTAINQTLFTDDEAITIIGVMPASFRFPTALAQIWRPLDFDKWQANIRHVARLADGQTLARADQSVAARQDALAATGEFPRRDERMRLRSLADSRSNPGAASLFALLAGAAGCLLLIACANVTSLELAAAARRARTFAIQSALGASRAALVRIGLLEGAIVLGASGLLAFMLIQAGLSVLDAQLTTPMRRALTNPLDVDERVVLFTFVVAGTVWILTALPSIWRVSRLSVVDGLRDDARTMPVTRGAARSRQWLVAGQIALTTLLLVGSLLHLRGYLALTGLDKGFDSANVATLEVFPASDAPTRSGDLESALLERLRATPWIRSVARTNRLPPATQGGSNGPLTIDDREPTEECVMLHIRAVDPEYFNALGITLSEGRVFDATTPLDQVLVDERFARTFWPDGSAMGARFRHAYTGYPGVSSFQIAGITRPQRNDRVATDEGDDVYVVHIAINPTSHPLMFVAKLDDERRVADLGAIVRGLADRSIVRVETLNARYARLHADTRLAAAVTSGFGVVALLVATTGVYAVMTFLVSGRAREMAIRMALGAGRGDVRRLVLHMSLGPVAAGAVVGLASAAIVSHWLRAQFAGISPADPVSYVTVAGLLATTALAATWWPARRASRVDPAVTLRAE